MTYAHRLRLAMAWEQYRIPLVLLAVGLLLAGSYLPTVARIEAALAITLVPIAATGYAVRSVWNSPWPVRAPAVAAALAAGGGSIAAIWGVQDGAKHPLMLTLGASAVGAALAQLWAARRGERTFFAIGPGIAVALGLGAPHHVELAQQPSSVLGALLVALVAGGGAGALVVAIGERVDPRARRSAPRAVRASDRR